MFVVFNCHQRGSYQFLLKFSKSQFWAVSWPFLGKKLNHIWKFLSFWEIWCCLQSRVFVYSCYKITIIGKFHENWTFLATLSVRIGSYPHWRQFLRFFSLSTKDVLFLDLTQYYFLILIGGDGIWKITTGTLMIYYSYLI